MRAIKINSSEYEFGSYEKVISDKLLHNSNGKAVAKVASTTLTLQLYVANAWTCPKKYDDFMFEAKRFTILKVLHQYAGDRLSAIIECAELFPEILPVKKVKTQPKQWYEKILIRNL